MMKLAASSTSGQ